MTLGRTPSQTVGPYFTIGLCRSRQNELVPGGSVRVTGRVLDGAGDPVPDAVVELWQEGDAGTLWGRCGTDADGAFEFVTDRPATGHAEVMVFARGLLRHLVTCCQFGDGDVVQFDVHLQGEQENEFFDV
jgi:protocatechuate 3,4-dioxygenase, alpha subunit